ncbi:MAG: kynureninase [Sphingomicrobium sp.]
MTVEEARALDAADALKEARSRFRLPAGKIYLDGNSLGALPVGTSGRLAETIERQWGEDLIASWNKHHWIDASTRIAAKLAPIVGAAPDELLVADSTSINLFKLLASALAARPGRTIILSEEGNFPTDLYIAAAIPGATLKTVPTAEITAALTNEVAVLMLTHVDYRSARTHDMAALTAAAQDAGALMLWDLSHSAGAMQVDLTGAGADLAVGCGYKYLNGGPGAPAFLFVARALQAQLANPLPGWLGHESPFNFDPAYRPAPGIARFQSGTPSILAMNALEAGLDTFEGIAVADIEAKSRRLTDFFIACVEQSCTELQLASPRESALRGSHVVFAHPHSYALMQALIERQVIGDLRAPDLVRFGFAPLYNSFEDAWRAATIIGQILRDRSWDQPRFHQRSRVT